jgi:hypothetical protein
VSEIGLNQGRLCLLYVLKASSRKSKSSTRNFRDGQNYPNSIGRRDLAKHFRLVDCIRDLFFLAISETGKRDFSQSLLNRLSGAIAFMWFSCPPRG